MGTQEIISLAVQAGYEVTEYEGHYSVMTMLDVKVVVTVPKVPVLVMELVTKIKAALGL